VHEAEAPTSALESYPAIEGLRCSHTTSCHPQKIQGCSWKPGTS